LSKYATILFMTVMIANWGRCIYAGVPLISGVERSSIQKRTESVHCRVQTTNGLRFIYKSTAFISDRENVFTYAWDRGYDRPRASVHSERSIGHVDVQSRSTRCK
jgi:hypothetical protein